MERRQEKEKEKRRPDGPKPQSMEERWVPNGSATPIYCLSDGATCSCCYALLSRRAAPRCRWWLLRCCAPRPGGKELANSLLVGLQLVVAVMGGTASSPFWEGEVVYVVDWKGCSCFSLCAGAFLALSWPCVLRGSFVFSLSGGLTDIRMWYPGLAGRACSMLVTTREDPESWTIKPGSVGFGVTVTPGGQCACMQLFVRTLWRSQICRD